MQSKISARGIVRVMVIILAVLLLLDIAGYVSQFFLGFGTKLAAAFGFGNEKNFPTYLSSIGLLFCAVLLMVVSLGRKKEHKTYAGHWAFLSAVFVFLSIDEMIEIHERLIIPFRRLLHTHGVFRFAWVIPYGILLIVLVLVYWKFLWDLPERSRFQFILAGFVYVLGAMGFELAGSAYFDTHLQHNFTYAMIQTVEETLEMAGIIIFAYALASYIKDEVKQVTVSFE